MKRTYGLNGTYAVPDWDRIREIADGMPTLNAAAAHAATGGRPGAIGRLREVEAVALRAARSTNTRYDGDSAA